MRAQTSLRRLVTIGLVAGSLTVGLSAVAASSGAAVKPKLSGDITFAEAPGANPNYIFPYMSCTYFSVDNINQFEDLMYRPLYWFGLGASSAVQYALSPGNAAKASNGDKTYTIDLKGWKFSDGQTVDAQSVMFFLNMYKADPDSYCGYNPGFGIPDQLSSASGSGNTVTLNFKQSVNPNWILYNYFSEITPFPEAWDKTSDGGAAGSGHCSTDTWGSSQARIDCDAVEAYLDNSALTTSNYTNSTWQVDDGPYKLTSFDSLGNATFVPNTSYSGPVKSKVGEVQEVAYATTSDEETALRGDALQLGFVDPTDLPGPSPKIGKVGPNIGALTGHYNLVTGSAWSFNYTVVNYNANNGAILKQLYVRQALQESTNQPGIIASYFKNYGAPTCSPLPPNTPTSISGKVSCAYTYSLSKAETLLANHGWKNEGGTLECEKTGTSSSECGSGITANEKLSLSYYFLDEDQDPSGIQGIEAEISAWKSMHIAVSSTQDTFDNVISNCTTGVPGGYDLCFWGGGWLYAPDYYPSGETLFTPTGGFNLGGYVNTEMTSLIDATTFGTAKLTAYAKYAAQQLPVLYEPNATGTGEVNKDLHGVLPPDPLENFMPEYLSL